MGSDHIEVRNISAEATYPIRQVVLRPGKPVEEVYFSGDTAITSFHLGAFLNGKLLGVASFMKNSNPAFQSLHQFQLRGMAVLPEAQGLGIGKVLLLNGEQVFKEKWESGLLWFNARESAVQFYEKFGYHTYGDFFEIPNVCIHIVMYKEI